MNNEKFLNMENIAKLVSELPYTRFCEILKENYKPNTLNYFYYKKFGNKKGKGLNDNGVKPKTKTENIKQVCYNAYRYIFSIDAYKNGCSTSIGLKVFDKFNKIMIAYYITNIRNNRKYNHHGENSENIVKLYKYAINDLGIKENNFLAFSDNTKAFRSLCKNGFFYNYESNSNSAHKWKFEQTHKFLRNNTKFVRKNGKFTLIPKIDNGYIKIVENIFLTTK